MRGDGCVNLVSICGSLFRREWLSHLENMSATSRDPHKFGHFGFLFVFVLARHSGTHLYPSIWEVETDSEFPGL